MKTAFTLIELLVVVMIIAILSAFALPRYTVAKERSYLAEAFTNIRHAQQSIILHKMNHSGRFVAEDIMEFKGGEWDSTGRYYCAKNFTYEIYDGGDRYSVMAHRVKKTAVCPSFSDKKYALYVWTELSDGEDVKSCLYYTDLGEKLCKGLEGQGYVAEEPIF